jgi:regulator of protease activity HflC (stomatin/prohibitin superfamily)
MDMNAILITLIGIGTAGLLSSMRVLWEYERGVIFRLGKLTRAKGPGLVFLVPFAVERMRRMDLRIVALDIAPQDTITKDNVSVKVNAVVYFRVADPAKAVVEIEDYYFATSQLAQTTLRSVIGQSELDELLAERERINDVVRKIIDEGTDEWGVEVTGVEIKDIDLPHEMKRAMAKQAEAERERRGKVIAAEGEYQASTKLALAAEVITRHPVALQLRFLQTVVEVAAENNSTTLFPIPVDLFAPFIEKATGVKGGGFPEGAEATDEAAGAGALGAGGDGSALEAGEAARLLPSAEELLSAAVEARKALGLADRTDGGGDPPAAASEAAGTTASPGGDSDPDDEG